MIGISHHNELCSRRRESNQTMTMNQARIIPGSISRSAASHLITMMRPAGRVSDHATARACARPRRLRPSIDAALAAARKVPKPNGMS